MKKTNRWSVTRVAIFGSTGSIGTQALEVIQRLPGFAVTLIAAQSSKDRLLAQAQQFHPQWVCLADKSSAAELSGALPAAITVTTSLEEGAQNAPYDIAIIATNGASGILPALRAIQRQKRVALATKEVLVAAGELIMAAVKHYGAELLPIDSEHSAIVQTLVGEERNSIKKLIVTCSGGALREKTLEDLKTITVQDALAHPSWVMGKKITIDSATLMNKGFEVIEAHHLFSVPYEQIEVVIHPQSIVHSLVEFVDGSIKAQLGYPDMHLPIQYALTYPQRRATTWDTAAIANLPALTFSQPDTERFPLLQVAFEAGRRGGYVPAVVNAADEIAVAAFLEGHITFLEIAKIIRYTVQELAEDCCAAAAKGPMSLDEVLRIDALARSCATMAIGGLWSSREVLCSV